MRIFLPVLQTQGADSSLLNVSFDDKHSPKVRLQPALLSDFPF